MQALVFIIIDILWLFRGEGEVGGRRKRGGGRGKKIGKGGNGERRNGRKKEALLIKEKERLSRQTVQHKQRHKSKNEQVEHKLASLIGSQGTCWV